ncbi:MAG: hypothetical protein JWP17_1279 [Solirubrobacterales bacterium]|jgi:hypothetical protein|nr:hypothetical protein [Solirubrobacterales bacterium]
MYHRLIRYGCAMRRIATVALMVLLTLAAVTTSAEAAGKTKPRTCKVVKGKHGKKHRSCPKTALPKMLMLHTLWQFDESYPSLDAFHAAVLAYQKDILGHDGWSDEGVVLPSPSVTISYEHAEDDDLVRRSVDFVADDPAGFTAAELLWKLNEDAVPRMAGQDAVFFEGLARVDSDSTPPRYSVLLGS